MSSSRSKILEVFDNPKFISLKTVFNLIGWAYTNVECEYNNDGWAPNEVVSL